MTELQKNAVSKFLNLHYGNLIVAEEKNGRYKTFSQKNFGDKIFILDSCEDRSIDSVVFVSSKYVIDPILNMFNIDYNETYNFVEEWFSQKYKTKLDIITGY
jgi:hypothetical protein